jgi:hypothetical protein
VLFGKWSGTEVVLDRHDLLIMKESDVIGVLAGDKPERFAISPGNDDQTMSMHH